MGVLASGLGRRSSSHYSPTDSPNSPSLLVKRQFAFPILALLAVAALGLWLLLPGGALRAQDGAIEYAENGTDPVATYTAVDDDGDEIVSWTLDGADAGDFMIENGVLTFSKSPDFENPVDADMGNTYDVTVKAKDSTRQTGTKEVTVNVTNVDEAGMVMLSALQPAPGVEFTAMLTDLDNRDADLSSGATWQWARSLSKSSGFSDIDKAAMRSYMPKDGDKDYYLRVTATYTDGHSAAGTKDDKTASMVSANAVVAARSSNSTPEFGDDNDDDPGNQTARDVNETAVAGTNVGDAVVAEDDDGNDVLTYTLVDDMDKFVIDRETGQISVAKGAKFNHVDDDPITDAEKPPTYTVTVIATDPTSVPTEVVDDTENASSRDTIDVTITVNPVDEAPVFTTGDTKVDFPENGVITVQLGAEVYAANDPEEDEADILALGYRGADSGKFDFDETNGELRFKAAAAPDFEKPGDANKDNVYEVTITATDEKNNIGTRDVKVTVTNANEDGMVTLSRPQPRVGFAIAADLEDEDGGVNIESWKWYRTTDNELDALPAIPDAADDLAASSAWDVIERATAATYTPVDDVDDATKSDVGRYLLAVVSYTDAHEPMDETGTPDVDESKAKDDARMISDNPVEEDTRNKPPVFRNNDGETIASTTRKVSENTDANVGSPVTATDPDPNLDPLIYTLSGADAGLFSVAELGQITVKSGTKLDYEARTTYMVTVAAEDSFGGAASIDVTITVTDVEEAPEVTGIASMDYAESGTGAVATYTAPDDDGDDIVSWTLGGADAEVFMIENGVLTFRKSPDFEAQVDMGMDNTYDVTVMARDGTRQTGTKAVTVNVTNVDEAGMVELSALQPAPGVEFTAMLTDPDNGEADLSNEATWQWARSRSKSSGFSDIDKAAMSSYTPKDGDQGYYLRVTATYTDGHSAAGTKDDKTASMVSANAVVAARSSNSTPEFGDDNDDDPGNQTARDVNETAVAGTNVGDAVVAEDDDGNDVLTYTLVDDMDKFVIDRETGQISVAKGAKFNHVDDDPITDAEKPPTYTVTVIATDPTSVPTEVVDDTENASSRDTIDVTITVNPVDEAPVFTTGDTKVDFPENGVITVQLGAEVYAANDPEEDEADILALGYRGADSGKFDFDETNGELRFKAAAAPDFEKPGDANKDNVYEVTITATDEKNNIGTRDVKVTVTNANEDGMVTLSRPQPRVGFAIAADLEDEDGGVNIESWKWYRTTDNELDALPAIPDAADDLAASSAWDVIERATAATYTPVDDVDDATKSDVGRYLLAVVSYTDAHEPMDETGTPDVDESKAKDDARMISDNPVEEDTRNKPPVFRNDDGEMIASTTREVAENTKVEVGNAVTAEDPDPNEDPLIYTLSGADAGLFSVASDGQIKVKSGTKLDYEARTTYMVTVTAEDSFTNTASIDVTITVTDVDEAPMIMVGGLAIAGPASESYAEDRRDAVATYSATGPESAKAGWSLSGDDAGAFSISSSGELTFKSGPDFESPADDGTDNVYMVTVNANDGTYTATHNVVVTVTDVVEETPVVDDPVALYDTNIVDGKIDGTEVLAAVKAYFAGDITGNEVLAVVKQYFADARASS